MDAAVATKKLSTREKEELLREILGHKYSSAGNNLPVLSKIIDNIGYVDNAFTLAELVTFTNTILTGSRFLTVAASGASVLSIFLSPVSHLIAVINAWQTGHKMYAYRAVAYTLTAWAFNKSMPSGSPAVISNIRSGAPVRKQSVVQEYNKAWQDASRNLLGKINSGTISTRVPKEALKLILRAIADNSPQKLCEMLLRGVEDQFEAVPRITWKANYKIRYPH